MKSTPNVHGVVMYSINILPCKKRLEGIKDGQLMFFICNCPDAKEFKHRVTEDICNQCSSREGANQPVQRAMAEKPSEKPSEGSGEPPTITPNGTLIYVKEGWQPPPCPPGYRRRSNDLKHKDAWILEPMKPPCKHIDLVIGEVAACGCHRVIPTCVYQGRLMKLTSDTCQTCKEPGYAPTP